MLGHLEAYFDAAPRPNASVEEIGPMTLFIAAEGWPYYARPRLGLTEEVTADDVRRVLERQRDLGVPRSIAWVQETTPSLGTAARAAGMRLHQATLMVLGDLHTPPPPVAWTVRMLADDDAMLPHVLSAVGRGFSEGETLPGYTREQMARGLLRLCGCFDMHQAAVGGGSHIPRGDVTEIVGVAVVPEARGRGLGPAVTAALALDAMTLGIRTAFCSAGSPEAVRICAGLGFDPVGTAVVASADERG